MGISAAVASLGELLGSAGAAASAGLTSLGVGAATSGLIGGGITSGLEGALAGAGTALLTGGKPLKAAGEGFGTGFGAGALGPTIGGALGVGDTVGGALGGALGSSGEAALTGQKIGPAALTGAIGGGLLGATSPSTTSSLGGLGGETSPGVTPGFGESGTELPDLTKLPENFSANTLGYANNSDAAFGTGTGLGAGTGQDFGASPIAGGDSGVLGNVKAAATATPTASATSPSSLDKFFQNPSLSTAGGVLSANPLLAIQGAGLLASGAAQKDPAALKALEAQAGAASDQSKQLSSYLFNGTLPPGAQTAVNQGTASAKAAIRSKYASLGLSGSTMEAQDLAHADQAAATQVFNIADTLLTQGFSEAGLSSNIYQAILAASSKQDQSLQTAIANFAAASAGGGDNPLKKAA